MNARLGVLWLAAAWLAVGQPVPSHWKGTAKGEVHRRSFRLPVRIDLVAPLPFEENPFNLFLSSDSANRDEASRLGSFLLKSAAEYFTPSGGKATLEYFRITRSGPEVTAVLRNTQTAAAAAMNTFVAPNVSAEQASDLMRGVMEALGPTEFHLFRPGASIKLRFKDDVVTGTVEGTGFNVLGTAAQDVRYRCTFEARQVKPGR